MKYRHQGKINQKKALLRGTVLAVIKNGGIDTSKVRAKEAQKMLDSLVTIAKADTLASRKRISSRLATNREVVANFFEIVPTFKDRVSGFTRIIKLGRRKGDATEMVRLEWVVQPAKKEEKVVKEPKVKKEKTETKIEEAQEVASA